MGPLLRGEPLPVPAIDMHGHLGEFGAFYSPRWQAGQMVRQMDGLGIESIVCSHYSCISGDVAYGNNVTMKTMQQFPGRIHGYATAWPVAKATGLEEVERCLDAGMIGIKLHSGNGIAYDADCYAEILQYADAHALPMLLHTSGNMDEYECIFRDHPNVRFILAHTGMGGAEKYVDFALRYDHLFLELCLSDCHYRLVEHLVAKVGAHRILFGSDCPFYSPAPQLGKIVCADISDEDKGRILRSNAMDLLNG